LLGLAGLFAAAPQSKGASILVGQCIEFAACWSSTTPTAWSDTLTLGQLTSLGLGSSVPLIVAQTSMTFIRLGVTTFAFTTGTGPVTETLGEFSGGPHTDPCNLCEIDTVGMFLIPANATAGTISGFFGNSVVANSAGANVCLASGLGACATIIPEPGTISLVGAAFIGLSGLVYWRRKTLRSEV
jgi:hypothetical protein